MAGAAVPFSAIAPGTPPLLTDTTRSCAADPNLVIADVRACLRDVLVVILLLLFIMLVTHTVLVVIVVVRSRSVICRDDWHPNFWFGLLW